jgi:hypothetical protein
MPVSKDHAYHARQENTGRTDARREAQSIGYDAPALAMWLQMPPMLPATLSPGTLSARGIITLTGRGHGVFMVAFFSKIPWASAALVAAVSLSCSSGEQVVINERMFLREGETLVPKGGGCLWTRLPSSGRSSSGSANGDISVQEGAEGDAFVVRVFSGQQLLQSRSYSAAWLRSGQVDEFDVTTQTSALYLLRYWGGTCADLDASSPGT